MSDERFTIRWSDGRYTVSIPRYDGGEVVTAEHHDAEVAALRAEVERMRAALESMQWDAETGRCAVPGDCWGDEGSGHDATCILAAPQPEGDSDE